MKSFKRFFDASFLRLRSFAPILSLAFVATLNPAHSFNLVSIPEAVSRPEFTTQADVMKFIETVLRPILEESGREHLVRIALDDNNPRKVILKTASGIYSITLDNDESHAYPSVGMPHIAKIEGTLRSSIVVSPSTVDENQKRVRAIIRSMFRADPEAHVHLRPTTARVPTRLSWPQRAAIDAALSFETHADENGLRLGLVMPVGLGKTVTAAHYIREVSARNPSWKKKPKVLFIVENRAILDGAVASFQRDLEINESQTARIYGVQIEDDEVRRSSASQLNEGHKMVAITRSGLTTQLAEINRFMESDPEQPWVVVFDEAHHTGNDGGQFDAILESLHHRMHAKNRALFLSATFWHTDQTIITDVLDGHVHGSFLDDEEQDELQNGLGTEKLCIEQMYRAMQEGYLSPIYGIQIITQVGGRPTAELLSMTLQVGDQQNILIHRSLIEDMARRILANRVEGQPDRMLIVAPSRAHADFYAAELAKLLDTPAVRAIHRGKNVRQDGIAWLDDSLENETEAERQGHKYGVVVDMFNEGVDVRGINAIMIARPYDLHTSGGIRSMIQIAGRGTRVAENKSDLRLIDYSGSTAILARRGASISVENPPPNLENPERPAPVRRPPASIIVDDKSFNAEEFEAVYMELFGEIFRRPKKRILDLDLEIFRREGVTALEHASQVSGFVSVVHVDLYRSSARESSELKRYFQYLINLIMARTPLNGTMPTEAENERWRRLLTHEYDKVKFKDGTNISRDDEAAERVFSMIAALVEVANERLGMTIPLAGLSSRNALLEAFRNLTGQAHAFLNDEQLNAWMYDGGPQSLKAKLLNMAEITKVGRIVTKSDAVAFIMKSIQPIPAGARLRTLKARLAHAFRGRFVTPHNNQNTPRSQAERFSQAFVAIAETLNAIRNSAVINIETLRQTANIESIYRVLYPERFTRADRQEDIRAQSGDLQFTAEIRSTWIAGNVMRVVDEVMRADGFLPKNKNLSGYFVSLMPYAASPEANAGLKSRLLALNWTASDLANMMRNEGSVYARVFAAVQQVALAMGLDAQLIQGLADANGLRRILGFLRHDGIDPEDSRNIGAALRMHGPEHPRYKLVAATTFRVWQEENTFNILKEHLTKSALTGEALPQQVDRLLRRLKNSIYVPPIRRFITMQTWSATDSSNAANILGAAQRVFVSLAAIATEAKAQGLTDVEPTEIYRRETMAKFLSDLERAGVPGESNCEGNMGG